MRSRLPGRLFGTAALAAASIILAVVLIDVVLRVRAPVCTESFGLWRPDPWVGWTHVPGMRARVRDCLPRAPEFETHVAIDSHGLRDVERSLARPAGHTRVLVLGDSFTEAIQVEHAETFAARLERLLGPRVEILNGGVAGYGTDNTVLAYEHSLWRYEVDLVLLALSTGNDVYENSRELVENGVVLTYADKPYFVRRGGTLVLENYPVPPVIARGSAVRDRGRRMLASSPLVRLLGWTSRPVRRDLRLIGGRRDAPRSLLEQYLLEERPGWAEARAVTEDLVRRLSAVVARQGARLAVVLVPDKMAVLPKSLDTTFALSSLRGHAHDALRPHRELVALVERTGIPFLALLPDFQQHQAAGSPPTFFARDSHWNAAGHALAAERLAPFVRALLADAPSR